MDAVDVARGDSDNFNSQAEKPGQFVKERVEEKDEFVDRATPVLKDEIISTISTRACGM